MSINNPSTGGVSTSSNGTNNTIAKFTGTSSIANSSITDDGTKVVYTLPIQQAAGSTTAPSYSFSGDTVTGIYSRGAGTWTVSVNQTPRLDIQAAKITLSQLPLGWAQSNDASAATDTAISRSAAATVAVGSGANGNTSGTVLAASFKTNATNVNVTPVTVSTNTTGDQNLMSFAIPANALNSVGRTLKIWSAGVYTTPVGSTATITIKVNLGAVTLLTFTSSANPGSVTNNSWNVTGFASVQTSGASGVLEAHGNMVIDLGASPGLADSTFSDTNTAVSSAVDLTASQTLQVTIAFSSASASNTATQRQMVLESAA